MRRSSTTTAPANGWRWRSGPADGRERLFDLADILVNTRLAADRVGATKMDRPEWGAVDPRTGEVYFTLTNNTRRTEARGRRQPAGRRTSSATSSAGARTGTIRQPHGFTWDLFIIAGDRSAAAQLHGQALNEDNIFCCPDGIWFDKQSRLWIQTDIGEAQQNQGRVRAVR
jgi:uncharacterized protein